MTGGLWPQVYTTGGVLGLILALGCGERSPPRALDTARALRPHGVQSSPRTAAHLAWRADGCPRRYALVDQTTPEPRDAASLDTTLEIRWIPSASPWRGKAIFDSGGIGQRDVVGSAMHVGPASPSAACMPMPWDPLEDALALGWPRLPDRLTAVGETWDGLRVQGRCHQQACIDPATGKGSARPCVTPPWRERLLGFVELEGRLTAIVEGHWSDGRPTAGITAERQALIDVTQGRPIAAKATVLHQLAVPRADGSEGPSRRTWTLQATDSCPALLD